MMRTPAYTNFFLPFDPGEVIQSYWRERYRTAASTRLASRARSILAASYYRVRPGIPRAVQLMFRRTIRRLQAHSRFPAWPVETALHDLYDLLFRFVAALAREPVPWISPWPGMPEYPR